MLTDQTKIPLLQTIPQTFWQKINRIRRDQTTKSTFKKELSRIQLVLYGIGCTIGAGIFALPGLAVQYTGPSMCISFLIIGAVSLSTAMMYAELCARYPSNGSAFSYVYATFGELAAWIVGWNILPFYGASCSAKSRALVSYSLGFFEKFGFKFPKWISNVTVFGIEECCPLAVIYLGIFCLINCLGTKQGAQFNSTLTVAKLVTLLFVCLVALSRFQMSNMTPFVKPEYGFGGIVTGTTILFFTMTGFDFISTISEEAKDTQKDAPNAMRETVIICTLLYIFVAISLTGMGLGKGLNYAPETALADSFNNAGIQWMTYMVYICAMTGITASCFTTFMGTVRVLMTFSRDGLLPEFFKEVNPSTGMPLKNCFAVFIILSVLAFFQEIEELFLLISLGTLLVFSFVASCGVALRYTPEHVSEVVSNVQEDLQARILQKLNLGQTWVWIFTSLSFISAFCLQRNFSWVLSLISVLPCVGALVKLCQFKQVNMPKEGCYVAPFVPILPAIGIYFNLVLAWNTKNVTWFHLILYTSVGLVIYFVYGIQNSKVGRT